VPTGSQTGQPPLPPDVKSQQQGSEAQQFAQGAAQQQQKNAPDAGKEFVMKGFADIAKIMEKQVQVIQADYPQLMPFVTKAVTALKMIEQGISQQSQGQGQAMPARSEPQPNAEGQQAMGQ